uniref:Uncharacterized protein n=1 Tax=Salmo trutta TaxID=8032 RepID=A0A674EQI4_SALTR
MTTAIELTSSTTAKSCKVGKVDPTASCDLIVWAPLAAGCGLLFLLNITVPHCNPESCIHSPIYPHVSMKHPPTKQNKRIEQTDVNMLPSFFCLNVHYMTKRMWTPARRTPHFKITGINMELVPPFAATLLRRLSSRCLNIAAGTCYHSATRALVRSGTDVGRLGLALALRLPFTGTKGPSPNHEKQPQIIISPTPNVTRWHYVFGKVVFSWHLTNPV